VVLTRGQRWTFRGLALLSPLLLLAMLEVFLRIAGHGYATKFFIPEISGGQTVLTDNPRFGWRFFPREMARTPQPVVLAPRKESGTIRIFVFGESAAMGDPEPAFGLPRMLQAMLELRFPAQKFEVVNVAMTAINSHVVREIARDCAPLEGDVWVIYMGNNEVVGPFGGGTIFSRQVPSLAFIRASLWLKQFRVVQALTSLGRGKPAEWQGMEMFLQQQVRRDDARMRKVYDHFRENLDDILEIGSRAGARIVLSSVAVNLQDCPPFASQHSAAASQAQRAAVGEALAQGVALTQAGKWAEAHAALVKASPITGAAGDNSYAELFFQLARCELVLGSNDAARAHFNLAKEWDTLRFRADDEINAIIRASAAAARPPVPFFDAAEVLAKQTTTGLSGQDDFYEHVHFTWEGNYRLARALLGAVVQSLPSLPTNAASNGVPTMESCARRLGWTEWNQLEVYGEVRKRLQEPPFIAQFGQADRDQVWARRIDVLNDRLTSENYREITALYETSVQAKPDDWVLRENFAALLEANGEERRAMQQWKEVMRLLPHDTQAPYHLGNLLDAAGRSEEALPFFRGALRRNPELVEARNGLALALGNLGRIAEAKLEYARILQTRPKFSEARVNLGLLLAQQGKFDEARGEYELALQHDTNSTAAHINLGKLLNQRGDKAGAVTHYEAALRINPKNAVAHYNLGNALLASDPQAAAGHYAEAVRTRPDFAEARLGLAIELAKSGRTAQALAQFAEVIRLRPELAEARFNFGVALAKSGRFEEAARQFGETLRLQPDYPGAREFLQRAQKSVRP
jgi:tetratricopeptide (TPR) repeat protein